MIGIFDSGSGGLTVLRAIKNELPSADVIYFGDIAHAPYGKRSHEELSRLTIEAIRFLKENGAERIVSACNSVSTSLAISLLDTFSLAPNDIVEMVGPTVSFFKTVPNRTIVCATEATIGAGIYQNAFDMIGKRIETIPIPELAGAIEFGESNEHILVYIKKAFDSFTFQEGDVIIFGCTHYPLITGVFKEALPSFVSFFDPAEVVAQRVRRLFWPQEVGNGTTAFYISAASEQFQQRVAQLFPDQQYSITVVS